MNVVVGMLVLEISPEMQATLIALADSAAPKEICGVITHAGHVLPQWNCAADPTTGFDMEVLIDPETIAAVYHSHPNGNIHLSDDDQEGLAALYDHDINCRYLIVTPTGVYEYALQGAK